MGNPAQNLAKPRRRVGASTSFAQGDTTMAFPKFDHKPQPAPDVEKVPELAVPPAPPKPKPHPPFLVAGPMGTQEWVYPKH